MTQAGFDQNEQMKQVLSWAAILFAPTLVTGASLVTGVYGMSSRHMPELGWPLGCPCALLLMILLGLLLYAGFTFRGWP